MRTTNVLASSEHSMMFVNYTLTGNLAEVRVIWVASAFGYLPVTAVQILWINLVSDSGPALALAS